MIKVAVIYPWQSPSTSQPFKYHITIYTVTNTGVWSSAFEIKLSFNYKLIVMAIITAISVWFWFFMVNLSKRMEFNQDWSVYSNNQPFPIFLTGRQIGYLCDTVWSVSVWERLCMQSVYNVFSVWGYSQYSSHLLLQTTHHQ